VLVVADNGAEFLLDFATGQGVGLNVPMIAVFFFS